MNGNSDPTKVISPKVLASAAVYILGTGVLAAGAVLTPDLFDGLGRWGVIAYAGVVGSLGAVAGYLVRDPLRQ